MSHSSPSNTPSPDRRYKALLLAAVTASVVAILLSAAALLVALGIVKDGPKPVDFGQQARDYLMASPETIVEALNQMDARQKAAEENELTALISKRSEEIFHDAASPVAGNPKGDVTLVEFFDYNCPYCRKAAPIMDELVKSDQGVRVAFKEFPILGPGSTFAAQAALASQKQGKYLAFHQAMMAYRGSITEASTLEVAAGVGLDVEQLKKDMADPAIKQNIERNLTLAEDLRISGTPSFIAGKEILRGLADLDTMKQLIAKAREDKDK